VCDRESERARKGVCERKVKRQRYRDKDIDTEAPVHIRLKDRDIETRT